MFAIINILKLKNKYVIPYQILNLESIESRLSMEKVILLCVYNI